MASDAEVFSDKLERMFAHLVEAEQWERILELGPQLLSNDPENWFVHAMMAQAALEVDEKLKQARLHGNAALRIEPEESFSHLLMARIHRKANRLLDAKRSLLEALKFEPEDADLWQEFGWNCYQRGDFITAREAVKQARSFKPNDSSIENLATAVAGLADDESRLDVYDQIEGYERALRHDPEDATVMHNIGQVYLQDLDDGKNAEEWFRKAAQIDPNQPQFREGLIAAIRRRDPILRVLNFPWNWSKRAFRVGERWQAKKRWLIILLIPLSPIIGALLISGLAIWAVFLFGPAKLYEWLTVTEAMKKAGGVSSYNRGIHRPPFLLRLLIFLSIVPVFIGAVGWFFTAPAAKAYHDIIIGGGSIIATAFGIWWSAKRQNPS